MNKHPLKSTIILVILSILVLFGASMNVMESFRQNTAKFPEDLEDEHKFLKWINRWKERYPQLEADTFRKVDDGEIVSSTNPRYTFEPLDEEKITKRIDEVKDERYIVIAPDKLQYIDFRAFFTPEKEATSSYVYYFGKREDKLLYGPLFECKKTKCYFDRGFFLEPDLLYIPEVQEKIYHENPSQCEMEGICSFELFLHEFDLKKNKRTTYASTQLLTDFVKLQKTLEDY